MAIQGSVARILGSDALVINRGLQQGVREGMRFVVFVELDEVTDPEDGSSLGRLEVVKARVVATHVQEKMAVCGPLAETLAETENPLHHTLSSEMIAVSLAQRGQTGGSLNVDRQAVAGVPQVGPIQVGDRVRSVE